MFLRTKVYERLQMLLLKKHYPESLFPGSCTNTLAAGLRRYRTWKSGENRELFKPSKDSGSLQACNEKKFFGFGFRFFVSDVISNVGFWPFLADGDGTVTDCTYVAEKIFFSLPDPAPTARQKYFTEVFIGN